MTEQLTNIDKAPSVKQRSKRERGVLRGTSVTMSHGSGGKAMRTLIEEIFATAFRNDELDKMEDAAKFNLAQLTAQGDRLALTTDSYVVDPIFFPGGDIGKLAINGTVNDLAVSGALPLYLTCGMIIEEGLPFDSLRAIVASMKEAAEEAGVQIVTGDTKVVGRGAADKLFINTAGVGVIKKSTNIGAHRAIAGDIVIVNGDIGDHGAAIVGARGDLSLQNDIESDCCPLNGLIQSMLTVCQDIHCMRDATRGGVASVLNEIAESSGVCVRISESAIPIKDNVKGLCEILGLDPLYLANEGTLVAIVPASHAQEVLTKMKEHRYGARSAIIGEVLPAPEGRVVLRTIFGGERVVDMLIGDQLPESVEGRAMHELSITQNIVAIVSEHAKNQRVRRVKLQIGTLTSVVPDAVRFCFDVCAKGTPAEGAELEIQIIEARGVCNQCNRELALTMLAGLCECGSRNIRCVSGEELNVKEMEVA